MPRKNDPAYKTENSVFAARLREIMKERGENQTTLADKITSQYVTIQRQTISLYMSGQSRPDTERLTALAKTLNVSADWLLGLAEEKSPNMNIRSICRYTGLSEQSIQSIHDYNEERKEGASFIKGPFGALTFIDSFLRDPEMYRAMSYLSKAIYAYSCKYRISSIIQNKDDKTPLDIDFLVSQETLEDIIESSARVFIDAEDAISYYVFKAKESLGVVLNDMLSFSCDSLDEEMNKSRPQC